MALHGVAFSAPGGPALLGNATSHVSTYPWLLQYLRVWRCTPMCCLPARQLKPDLLAARLPALPAGPPATTAPTIASLGASTKTLVSCCRACQQMQLAGRQAGRGAGVHAGLRLLLHKDVWYKVDVWCTSGIGEEPAATSAGTAAHPAACLACSLLPALPAVPAVLCRC